MPFVQAKCPECGGMLAVDDSKKAANCQFCGEAFIVQEAVNNYITNNITNNNTTHNYGEGAVVNVYENTSKDFVIEAGVLKEYHGASANVVIPDGVKEIGDYCFKELKIESAIIPDSVIVIGYQAFSSCKNLTSITISNSVRTIILGAFDDCNSLVSVNISDTGEIINKLDFFAKYNYNKDFVLGDGRVLKEYKGSSVDVVIPDGVEEIADECFKDLKITSITIPNSVKNIGKDVFSGCENLNSVYINNLVAWCSTKFSTGMSNPLYVAKYLYLNNELVTDLVIPNDVISIGDLTFFGYKSIVSIEIPDSVKSIATSAFENCTNLTAINVDIKNFNYTSINGVLFNKEKTELIKYPASKNDSSYIIPDSVTTIGDSAFNRCRNLTSITIPNNVNNISFFAFSLCENLISVMIAEGVTSIDRMAFHLCTNLASITIPDSVTSIGSYAFYGCSKLTSITIPDSVTSIGFAAFWDCKSLCDVRISDDLFAKFKDVFPDGLYEQIIDQKKEIERQVKIQAEEAEKQRIIAERKNSGLCQHCGGTFKGLFSSKCSSCGRPKDY